MLGFAAFIPKTTNYSLHQIRCICQSLDKDSTSTLLHAFVISWMAYSCSQLSAKIMTDKFLPRNAL